MLPSFYLCQHRSRIQNGKVTLNLLIFATILIVGLIYLWQVNSLVSQGYKLRAFQKELKLAEDENKKMKIEISQAQSLTTLQELIKDQNLVSVTTTDHLEQPQPKVVSGQVVRRP